MKLKLVYLKIATSALMFLLFIGGSVWAQPKKITIGYSGPMSGGGAAWGQVFDRCCRLATEEINAKGGINVENKRYLLEVKTFDHSFDPAKSLEIVKRMVAKEKVTWLVIIGTAVTRPIIPFCEENKKIIMASLGGSEISKSLKQNYCYRFTTGLPEWSFILWEWISKNRPEWRTTVEIQPDDASGWEAIEDNSKAVFPKYGIKMLGHRFYRRGTTDFYPILVKLLALKPDVFHISNMPPADQGRVIRQAREMGYKGPFTGMGNSYNTIAEIAGTQAEGLIFIGSLDPTSKFATPEERTLYNKWLKKYGPGSWDFYGTEGCYSILPVVQALEKANTFDPVKLTKMMQDSEFTAFGRKLKFGGVNFYGAPARQIISPNGIYVLEKGKPRVLDIVHLPVDY